MGKAAPSKVGPSSINDAFDSSTPGAKAAQGTNGLGEGELDLRKLVEESLGQEAAELFDQLPMEQKREMAMQATIQRNRSQSVGNLLQTLHDMKKAVLQNTRG